MVRMTAPGAVGATAQKQRRSVVARGNTVGKSIEPHFVVLNGENGTQQAASRVA